MVQFLDALIALLQKHAPWSGFIFMAITGGIVAHVRESETKHPDYTLKQHMKALLRRGIMAVLAGALWYLIVQAQGWLGSPYAYVGASLVGLFAPEFFDLLWEVFKQRLLGAANHSKGAADGSEKTP